VDEWRCLKERHIGEKHAMTFTRDYVTAGRRLSTKGVNGFKESVSQRAWKNESEKSLKATRFFPQGGAYRKNSCGMTSEDRGGMDGVE